MDEAIIIYELGCELRWTPDMIDAMPEDLLRNILAYRATKNAMLRIAGEN